MAGVARGVCWRRCVRSVAAVSVVAGSLGVRAQSAPPLTQAQILQYVGQDREAALTAGARKEGEVVLYSGIIVNQALRPLAAAFSKKYPFIKLSYYRADSEEMLAKLFAEERANNVIGDVVEATGVGEEAIGANLAQPFTSPAVLAVPEKYRDPRNLWMPTRLSYFGAAINTRLVPRDQAPKTYEDLLDPKWKGKMAMACRCEASGSLGVTNLRLAWGEDKARAYLQKLSKQNVVNFGSGTARTLVDRVVAGEYSIALSIYAHHPLISKAKGAQVDAALFDPLASAAGGMIVPKNIRHPYSAMLLVDFLLSKEGQEIMAKADYFPVRSDVAAEPMLSPLIPSNAGLVEHFISPRVFYQYAQSTDAILRELFP
jgi:ABC-type Fe3+ transport system substrate-binding protein